MKDLDRLMNFVDRFKCSHKEDTYLEIKTGRNGKREKINKTLDRSFEKWKAKDNSKS